MDEGEGADDGQHREDGKHGDDQQRRRLAQGARPGPRRQRPAQWREGKRPDGEDQNRPGEPGEAVGEEDPGRQGEAEDRRAEGGGARLASLVFALEPVQEQGEGEDEERLAGLLEGALGEVRGAEVGDSDKDRGEDPAPWTEVVERGQGDERGENADREDLPDEGLTEADAR